MTLTSIILASATTFCNPLPLPDYPVGIPCKGIANGSKPEGMWKLPTTLQFRELADPTLLFEDGAWYIFPSAAQCWKSTDGGGTWKHIPLEMPGLGYAPTIVKHKGKFYVCGSDSPLLVADRPEGPWKSLGKIELPWIEGAPGQWDPMLFSDDDGRLYLYYGCTAEGGLWGCELDADNPTKVISRPKMLIPFTPKEQPWERVPYNPSAGWLEGSWMVKINGKYVFTYSASGTENATYAMGAAYGDSPLGTFTKSTKNPFFSHTEGLVSGTGHGSIVKGPDGGYWASYCIKVAVNHCFERMIGMDRIFLDENGEIMVGSATSTPQWLPGVGKGATGWESIPVTASKGQEKAADNSFATWSAPGKDPVVFTFAEPKDVRAFRLVWRDLGLDEERGVKRGPYRYVIEYRTCGVWKTLHDASTNDRDFYVDYREVGPVKTDALRLKVLGTPKGITPAIAEFTAFGTKADRPTLARKFAKDFSVGCAIGANVFLKPYSPEAKLVAREFSSITAENEMKPMYLAPAEGRYEFATADRFVSWGEQNGMKVIGHTLVWHSQAAEWMFKGKDGKDCSRDELIARMRDYIHTVVGRYKGRVAGWDVVNEAFDNEGNLHDNSPWKRIIGDDFLELAFKFAAEADPDAELYYNDFSMDKPGKRAGVVKMLRDFKAKGVRIDGVGMQSHGGVAADCPDLGEYEASIAAFEAEGVKVCVTELDLSVLPNAWEMSAEITTSHAYEARLNPWPDGFLPPAKQRELADRYAALFEIYRRHPSVDRVTIWGLSDRDSWLNDFPVKGRADHPLLFDRELHAKPAYWRLLAL